MSSNYGGGYDQYGGNPYGNTGAGGYDAGNNRNDGGGYGASNPYGGQGAGYGSSNPYGGQQQQPQATRLNAPAPPQHQTSDYSQDDSRYAQPVTSQPGAAAGPPPQQLGPQPLSREEFLARIDGVKARINELTGNISDIGALHQRMISSPDSNSSARLEQLVTNTQILNTGIKDEIKYLEKDTVRSTGNSVKENQIQALKKNFQGQLQSYQRQESEYQKRHRDAIARQYRIVNPEATDAEVQEAANADWGNEGVFQTALKTNRLGQASSVLGAVRARHNDILQIEKTMIELATLFQQLDEQVTYQEPLVQRIEQQTEQVKGDTEQANVHLDKGIKSALRARKLKWWCLGIVVLILAIIALVLGIYFGVVKKDDNNGNGK